MKSRSLCGLGRKAPVPVRPLVRTRAGLRGHAHRSRAPGTDNNYPRKYNFRSSMGGAVVMGWELNDSFNLNQAHEAIAEFKALRPYFYGDYYPLTEYSTCDEAWAAFQWDRPEQADGIVLAFRRPQAAISTMNVRLHNVSADSSYEVTFDDYGITLSKSAREFTAGLAIRIAEVPGSLLIKYRRPN